MEPAGDFAEDGTVRLFRARDLVGSEAGRAADGGVDERELLRSDTADWKVGGVGDAKGINGFERSYEAADFLFHNVRPKPVLCFPFPYGEGLSPDYSEDKMKFNPFFLKN
jgi:hypothetical protein